MNKCLIVLLNWNGSKDTISCISSLENDSSNNCDILVLDNASNHDELHILTTHCNRQYSITENNNQLVDGIESIDTYNLSSSKKLFIAKSKINHGFAKGCNIGTYFAHENRYELMLLLNNDTEVEPGFYPPLLNGLKGYFATIPQIRLFDPKDKIWNCGGTISKFGQRKYYYANKTCSELDAINPFNVTFATGCCILVRVSDFIDVGLFTERFFFGEEDIDLSLRLMKLDKKLICVPNSIIYHKVGSSIKGGQEVLLRKAFIHYLNRFINMKLHLGIIWWVWFPISLIKVFKNLMCINKVSLSLSRVFIYRLIKESYQRDNVDQDFFKKIMESGFHYD